MANVFLSGADRDIETAIMLEKAIVCDIGNAVAYTDGDRIFINTDDNLFKILPAYDHKMLKWLLWHERYHKELRHHNRFFKYLEELDEEKTKDEFHVTKSEVNIIMDILVHDSLTKLFPELVDTASKNLAQLRNRNSLGYTFKTRTLEEMLDEYKDFKKKDEEEKAPKETDEKGEETSEETAETKVKSHAEEKKDTPEKDKPAESKPEEGKPEINEDAEEPEEKEPAPLPDEHDKTDWSKLEELEDKEFIEEREGDRYVEAINRLKRKKFKLGKLTETLNGLVTSTRRRTYAMPSPIRLSGGAILKGSKPGRTKLYLCFDASGSMSGQMETFKEIISKSIPQAMETPTVWFSGYGERIKRDPDGRSSDYYKGTFKDFMPVSANNGYSDDGDRTIELCWKAEQQGYSPIGVTDGGGRISWATDMLKQLKRTVFVGQDPDWLKEVRKINPKIQTLDIQKGGE